MNTIKITDDFDEQIKIGKNIYFSKPSEYTARTMKYIINNLNKYMKNNTEIEKENAFFHSIYDYWVYGNDIEEEFLFCFKNKTHDEKIKYITQRNKFLYFDYLNDKEDEKIFGNKYLTYIHFKEDYKRRVIKITNEDDYDLFCDFIDKNPEFFVKPLSLALGIGVYKESIYSWSDKKTLFNYLLSLKDKNVEISWSLGNEIILEEIIKQCKEMEVLNKTTVNVIRLSTVLVDGKTKFVSACIRIGRYGKDTASDADGEIYCGIDLETGVINTDGITALKEIYKEHPDNGIKFKGFQIPKWNEMIELGEKISKKVPSVRYVGWDLALTDSGWVIVEGNEHGDFLSQIVYQKPAKEEFENLICYKPQKNIWWE